MDFYFPDSQDQIDPEFDFDAEVHPPFHVRQRDDRYAHEIHDPSPYSGILVSKTMVDGYAGTSRYTAAQRHRLFRLGVHEFFRLPAGLRVIGDCGGFSYVAEDVPPVTVEEVIDFYDDLGVDEGVSVDHVILDYRPDPASEPEEEWLDRQALTLELAAEGNFDDTELDALYGKGTGRRIVLAEVERRFKGAKTTMMREMDEASIATAPRLLIVRRPIQAASQMEVSEIPTTRLVLPFPVPPEDTDF